jgi:hypothetical protein
MVKHGLFLGVHAVDPSLAAVPPFDARGTSLLFREIGGVCKSSQNTDWIAGRWSVHDTGFRQTDSRTQLMGSDHPLSQNLST